MLKFTDAYFLSQHMIYHLKHSMCTEKYVYSVITDCNVSKYQLGHVVGSIVQIFNIINNYTSLFYYFKS